MITSQSKHPGRCTHIFPDILSCKLDAGAEAAGAAECQLLFLFLDGAAGGDDILNSELCNLDSGLHKQFHGTFSFLKF